jgi:hypothetical protein
MTPQSNFMVIAPIDPGRIEDLRKLLGSMTQIDRPGMADSRNALVPFEEFDRLHFARFMILEDPTAKDLTAYGNAIEKWDTSLVFMGDCDGPVTEFFAHLIAAATPGLRIIFSHCRSFGPDTNLWRWMHDHEHPPATIYVNRIGRTLKQVNEENALYNSIESYLGANAPAIAGADPQRIRSGILEFVNSELRAGRLTLTPRETTPPGWQLRNLAHCLGVPIILLLLSPFLLVSLPFLIYQLRLREKSDPEIAPRPDSAEGRRLANLEDYDVTNQYNAFGTVKPGLLRRWALTFLLWVVNYATRHIYNRSHLTRITTIHFARWVFLADKTKVFFASNYDGSDESYMDDFINKLGWGLNLVFGNGVGYPRTNWILCEGTYNEQKFKYFNRRHQQPTEVWYKAYPGLTTFDLARNELVRAGVQKPAMNDAETRDWLSLF